MQNNRHPHDIDTTDRLRADIDRGLGGDKVHAADPAAAPLGTDDEAAGRPADKERVRLARLHELEGKNADRGTHFKEQPGERTWVILVMAAAAAAIAAAAVIAAMP